MRLGVCSTRRNAYHWLALLHVGREEGAVASVHDVEVWETQVRVHIVLAVEGAKEAIRLGTTVLAEFTMENDRHFHTGLNSGMHLLHNMPDKVRKEEYRTPGIVNEDNAKSEFHLKMIWKCAAKVDGDGERYLEEESEALLAVDRNGALDMPALMFIVEATVDDRVVVDAVLEVAAN